MTKYKVTHSCGHEVIHDLRGKKSDRESRIRWLEGKPCTECWKKEKHREKDHAKATLLSEAKSYAEKNGFEPFDSGTEKQRDWAEVIRFRFAQSIEKHIKTADRILWDKTSPQEKIDLANFILKTRDWLSSWTDPEQIIKHRCKNKGYYSGANPVIIDYRDLCLRLYSLSPFLNEPLAKQLGYKVERAYLRRMEIQRTMAENPKPERPAWYQAMWDKARPDKTVRKAGWNGKIYGGPTIYIDGVRFSLSEEQKTELEQYSKALVLYKKSKEDRDNEETFLDGVRFLV